MTDETAKTEAPPLPNMPPVMPDFEWYGGNADEHATKALPRNDLGSDRPGGSSDTKKRRRRTQKAPEEPKAPPTAEEIDQISKACEAGFAVGFGIIASRRGEHWQLTPEESRSLGVLWGQALAPYMGKLTGFAMFAVAGIQTMGVFTDRMRKDAIVAHERKVRETPEVPVEEVANANAN